MTDRLQILSHALLITDVRSFCTDINTKTFMLGIAITAEEVGVLRNVDLKKCFHRNESP
jgi:hypothetical protein